MNYTSREVYEFISTQTHDPIVERKTCAVSGQSFAIFQSDLDFYNKISPTFASQKFQIPTPTLCPEERLRRRLLFKNERKLFRSTCWLSGRSIITTHAPNKWFTVYGVQERRSDKRNPMDYGRNYNSEMSFFEQYNNLYRSVPQIAMLNDNGVSSENIEYCQNVAYSKNCYLTTVAWKLENTYYSSNMAWWERLVDCFFTMESQHCYECTDSNHLYACFWLSYSYECQRCYFWQNLIGCQDCIWCVNLSNKQFYIFNEQYTKEEYEKEKERILLILRTNPAQLKQKFNDFVSKQVHKATSTNNAINTYGSNLYNAQNAIMSYNIQNARDTKYCIFGDTITDAMDLTVGWELELCYESNVPDHSYKTCFSVFCRSCTNVLYSEMCHHCQDCFGCVGLRNKQYCILNKQYTKEEYEMFVATIITHMQETGERWQFFPFRVAPYDYNISTVMDYFSLTSWQAKESWYTRYDQVEEINIPEWIKLIPADTLPLDSTMISNDIIHDAIVCEISQRPFRILKSELEFYKKWWLPFPRKHPDIRFEERIKRMPSKHLYLRTCDYSGETMLSVYPTWEPFPVYNEESFNKIFYS